VVLVTQVSFKNDEQWQGWKRKFILEYFGASKDIPATVKMGGESITQNSDSQLTGLTSMDSNQMSLGYIKPEGHHQAQEPNSCKINEDQTEEASKKWFDDQMNFVNAFKGEDGQVSNTVTMRW
jgi:hypothetical protein